jgi:signal transduction histidine kinase
VAPYPTSPAATSSELAALLKVRRQDLINRWSVAVTRESTSEPITRAELLDHIPRFIDELIGALHPDALSLMSLGENAVEHGAQRLNLGFNVAEVVREYGMLHRCIIDIAGEGALTIAADEQRVIARWVNQGLASAVSQYVTDRDTEQQREASENLGVIAHEIRTALASALGAVELLQQMELAGGGPPVELLQRSLRRVTGVVDNVLTHASFSVSLRPRLATLSLRKALEEAALDGSAQAQAKGIDVVVTAAEDLAMDADARLLRSAVANLLDNALKFSPPKSTVNIRASRTPGHMLVEIEDACGGLPPGRADDVFKLEAQRGQGETETTFGLGLPIAQQAARAHNGTLKVRDLPGKGCIFTLDLPAKAPPPTGAR